MDGGRRRLHGGAFAGAGIPGARLWHWPKRWFQRGESGPLDGFRLDRARCRSTLHIRAGGRTDRGRTNRGRTDRRGIGRGRINQGRIDGLEGLGHQFRGAVLGPGGTGGRVVVLSPLAAKGLGAQQQAKRSLHLTHHAGRLRGALHRPIAFRRWIMGQAKAIHGLGIGRNILGSQRRLTGIGRAKRGHLRDRGAIPAQAIRWRVLCGRRQGAAENAQEMMIGLAAAEIGWVRQAGRMRLVHADM